MKKKFCLLLSLLFLLAIFCSACETEGGNEMDHSEKAKVQNTLDEFALTAQDVDVKASGAKGDGSTDDKQAIQNAIQAASASASKRLVFTPGQYKLGRVQLQFPADVTVVFQQGATLLCTVQTQLSFDGVVKAGNYQIFKDIVSLEMKSTVAGNPMWFGAKGDGVTDDTDAIQRTIDLFNHVNFPYTSKGYLTKGFKITRNTLVEGANREKNVKLIAAAGTQNLITVKSSNVQMYCFDLDLAKAPSATGLYFDTSSAASEQNRFVNFNIYNAKNAVKDSGQNMVITTEFEKFRCYKGNGTAFVCNNMWGFMYLTDIVIDYSQSTTQMSFPAITVRNNAGMILTDVEIIGNENCTTGADGIYTNESQAMWFQHCTVKNVGGSAFRNTGNTNWHIYYYDCHAENTDLYGFDYVGGGWAQFSKCSVTGGKGMSLTGSGMQLTDVTVSGSKTNGITSTGSFSVFTDITLNNNNGNGIRSSGNSCSLINITGSNNSSALTNVSGSGSNVCTY